MKKKKFIRDYPWNDDEKKFVECDQLGCKKKGDFKAPKSISSDETYNFCLEHVKQYNRRWDFFAGKSQNEIYKYLKNEMYQNKPTKPMSEKVSSKINFEFDFENFFDEKKKFSKTQNTNNVNDEISAALELFKLDIPFKINQLKQRYNILVKKNHPDLHGGDEKKNNLLKKINIYYKKLQKIAS